MQISLVWHTKDDLDFHVIAPSGEQLWYENKRSRCGGCLDVDKNRDASTATDSQVENMFWPAGRAPTGSYAVSVVLYRKFFNSKTNSGCFIGDLFSQGPSPDGIHFQVKVQNRGVSQTYSGQVHYEGQREQVARFILDQPRPSLSLQLGSLYKGFFQFSFEVLDVDDSRKVQSFVNGLLMSLGASRHSGLTASHANELSRLSKILDRVDDVANFAGERHNAARLLQCCLQGLEMDEDSLRAACGGMAGSDIRKPMFSTLQFAKRITTRREWFEKHAEEIAHPMGVAVSVNKATGHFGRVGHNGVVIVRTPAPTVLTAAVIAKTAEAALLSCSKSDTDTYCASFCRQIRPIDTSNPDARHNCLKTARF